MVGNTTKITNANNVTQWIFEKIRNSFYLCILGLGEVVRGKKRDKTLVTLPIRYVPIVLS